MNMVGFDFCPKEKIGPYLSLNALSFGSMSKTVIPRHMESRKALKTIKVEGPGGRERFEVFFLFWGFSEVKLKRDLRMVV